MRDIREKILPATLLASADHTDTAKTSAEVDMRGFNACAFFMTVGTITGTGSVTPKMQESDASGSGFTDVAAADIIADDRPLEALESGENKRFGYAGIKRYVRVVTVVEGTVSAATYDVLAVQGEPALTPTDF